MRSALRVLLILSPSFWVTFSLAKEKVTPDQSRKLENFETKINYGINHDKKTITQTDSQTMLIGTEEMNVGGKKLNISSATLIKAQIPDFVGQNPWPASYGKRRSLNREDSLLLGFLIFKIGIQEIAK